MQVFISSWIICWEFCCCFWICSARDCIALSHSCRAPSGDCFTLSKCPSVMSSPYSISVSGPLAYRTRNRSGRRTRGGSKSRPSSSPSKGLYLGVGPYLAVDLLDEGLAVLVLLLVLADLPELLGGKAVKPLGDLRDGQLFVVGGLQRTEDSGFQLRLLCGLLGPPKYLIGLLGGLLCDPEPLPSYLLGGL